MKDLSLVSVNSDLWEGGALPLKITCLICIFHSDHLLTLEATGSYLSHPGIEMALLSNIPLPFSLTVFEIPV